MVDTQSLQTTVTYAQLDRRARAIAASLQGMGLVGQRVVLAFPSGLEFIAAYFGALYAGCVVVPVSQPRRRTLDQFHAIVADAGASVALSTAAAISQFNSMAGRNAALRWMATDEVSETFAAEWCWYDPTPDALAMVQYTSGSTRQPKGVMLSHANLMANTRAIAQAFEVRSDSASVFWLPAFHDMGLIGGVLVPVFSGVPSVVMSPTLFLQNPFLWLNAISTSRATISGGPNFAYDHCVRKITPEQCATLDLSAWSLAFVGAEPVQAATLARFAAYFGRCGFSPDSFYPCYGLAEATLMVAGPRHRAGAAVQAFHIEALAQNRVEPMPDAAAGGHLPAHARLLVGCGAPVGLLRVEIVDPKTLAPAAPNRVGEVWVAGDSVAQGYWQEPGRTAATFRQRLSGSGDCPFLRTGDVGFIHDHQLYITGRLDDLIIVRGLNHQPSDIEATARASHPLLQSGLGAAFAVLEKGIQHLVLVHEVELDGGAAGDLTTVLTSARAAVLETHGLALDSVVLIRLGTMARTTSGKAQRQSTQAAFLADQLRPLARLPALASTIHRGSGTPTSELFHTQSAAVAAVLQHARAIAAACSADLSPEAPISALGLDSLQRVELVTALDKSFGRHLPDGVYNRAVTLGDLAEAVQKHLIAPPPPTVPPSETEIPAQYFDVALFPEYLELKRLKGQLLAVAGTNPYFRVDQGDESLVAGPRSLSHIDGRVLTNFCIYDYLGMSHHPAVIAATKAAIDRYGTCAGASRLVSGEMQVHRELENALARFLGTPASLVLVSGHATNVTTIGHLLHPGDLFIHDNLAHNSILQGAKLSGATARSFPHNDWRALDTLLSAIRHNFRRVLVAIEGVYSMDGDFPDLAAFVAVKKKHGAMLMVDEAHSLGTMGVSGRGIGEHAGIDRADVELWMGTLSKSLASCGGYIAGSTDLIDYLKYTAPGFVYSVGMSPPNAAAALAALTLLRDEPLRVARLRELSALFIRRARQRGLDTGLSGGTPIIPVIIGNSTKCLLLCQALINRGINIQPILHPAVPEHATRLRFFITNNHTETDIEVAVHAVAEELTRLK